MIWPLFRFWGRNLSNFLLENLKDILKLADLSMENPFHIDYICRFDWFLLFSDHELPKNVQTKIFGIQIWHHTGSHKLWHTHVHTCFLHGYFDVAGKFLLWKKWYHRFHTRKFESVQVLNFRFGIQNELNFNNFGSTMAKILIFQVIL